MAAFRYPTVFFSHGTPMLAYGEDPYQETLLAYAESFPKPKAILCISAHSLSNDQIHVLKCEQNRIQHDFTGFPKDLYQIQYTCPGLPALSDDVADLLAKAGMNVSLGSEGPLDHGIWIPLSHLYPKGDVPVVRISLPINFLPAQILKMGHVLSKLREQGVLIMASGGAVHNLGKIQWSKKSSPGLPWATEFESWLAHCLMTKDVETLMAFEEHPHFQQAHPSTEHFLPIIFSIGSALPGDEVSILFSGIEYESLSMLCFSLNHAQAQALH